MEMGSRSNPCQNKFLHQILIHLKIRKVHVTKWFTINKYLKNYPSMFVCIRSRIIVGVKRFDQFIIAKSIFPCPNSFHEVSSFEPFNPIRVVGGKTRQAAHIYNPPNQGSIVVCLCLKSIQLNLLGREDF